MKLTRVERWMLANQCRILEALNPEEADVWAGRREALENGYELDYEWIAQDVYKDDDTLTADECREVITILEMHRHMKWSFAKLPDKTRTTARLVAFGGFDGNNETKQMVYAKYLRDQGKWKELELGDDFNSHQPMLETSRLMVNAWEASADKHNLSADDLDRIATAAGAR
jgi:uncharacterized protein YfbU (UPF0304 family)